MVVNFCIAYGLLAYRTREGKERMTALKVSCLAVTAMLILQYGVGTLLWFLPREEGHWVTVAAVQGNISSHEKWSSSTTQKNKEIYRRYTLEAAAAGADLVVWPETALPYEVTERNALGKFLSSLAKEAKVTVLVGCFTEDDEGEYNSIVCFLPDGSMNETVYSKRRLVPFGEFVPFRGLIETVIPPLADLVLSGQDVTPGEGPNVFSLEECRVGAMICFDSIYEELSRASVQEGAQLISLSTNDSWFTDSAALDMHNAQAQLRAIENGRFVVRSANTGISTVISDRGEVLEKLPPLEDGMIVREVRAKEGRTLYTRLGNVFVYGAILLILAVLVEEFIFRQRKKRK